MHLRIESRRTAPTWSGYGVSSRYVHSPGHGRRTLGTDARDIWPDPQSTSPCSGRFNDRGRNLSHSSQGFRKLVVAVNPQEHEVIKYVRERGTSLAERQGASLRCYEEEVPLGTVGGQAIWSVTRTVARGQCRQS